MKQGRILRLKQGYNPNSSSIGTIVFAMPAALLATTVAFGTAAGVIATALAGRRGGEPAIEEESMGAEDGGDPGDNSTPDSGAGGDAR